MKGEIILELNLCYGCMEPKSNDFICSSCGYNHNAPCLPSYLPPGTMLNERYYVGKLKSYNGESANYLGFDTITQTKVLIKEYMPDAICSRDKGSPAIKVKPNFIAQYKTFMSDFVELNKVLAKMRTLNHINAAIDMFGDNNTGYVIFSELDGITLNEYLKKNAGELTWEEVKKFFPPIFTTLSLVHNAGLIHRGISPENIIISEKGELKLTGFCIADARTANTELAPELYSGYTAPEQYNSANWQGTWTDVYGISALLYRILTGTTPVDSTSRMSNDTLLEPALINNNIPRNVSKVIMNGMHMSSDMRIQTVTELVTQLFEQPEYNSVRLSSSSTQTVMIPKQNRHTSSKNKTRTSRKSVFFSAGAVTLCILMVFFVVLLINLDDTSNKINPSITGDNLSVITTNGSQASVSGTPSEGTETESFPDTVRTADNPSDTQPAVYYFMTDFTGKDYELIQRSETYSSLVFIPEFEYSDVTGKGFIISQSIEANERYEEGDEITVKVSLGPKLIPVPEYVSMSKKDYFTSLNELGIKYEETEFETSDVKEGYVAKLSKEPGQTINAQEGEMLTVYVAVNPPETEPVIELPPDIITEETTIPPADTREPDIIITFYN